MVPPPLIHSWKNLETSRSASARFHALVQPPTAVILKPPCLLHLPWVHDSAITLRMTLRMPHWMPQLGARMPQLAHIEHWKYMKTTTAKTRFGVQLLSMQFPDPALYAGCLHMMWKQLSPGSFMEHANKTSRPELWSPCKLHPWEPQANQSTFWTKFHHGSPRAARRRRNRNRLAYGASFVLLYKM